MLLRLVQINTQRLAGIESDLQVWWNTLAVVVDGLEESPIFPGVKIVSIC